MSDKEVTFAPQAGTPEGKGATAEVTEAKQTGAFDVDALMDKFGQKMDEKLSAWDKKQQGLRKRQEDRIKKEFERQVNTLKSVGVEATEQQKQAIYNSVAQSVLEDSVDGTEAPSSPGTSQQTPTASRQPADPFIVWAQEQAELHDTDLIRQDDPEAQTLDNTSEAAWKRSYIKALTAKAQRVQIPPQSRIASAVTGVNLTGGDLVEAYREEMLDIKNRGKEGAIQAIKDKYRKRGLDVDQVTLWKR